MYSSHHAYILKEEGVKILINYPQASDMFKREPRIPGGFKEVLIDSGGYQLQTGVAFVSLKAYAFWLQFMLPKHPEVAGYMNLDILNDPIKTLENQFYLESEGLSPIPIWHDGEDVAFLDLSCDQHEWVSIGGLASKGTLGKRYITSLLTWLTNRYPNNRFHMFGIGISGVKAYQQIRPYSCDFSTWSTVARFGHEIVLDKKQIIKEVALPKDSRDRLRIDAQYLADITRQAIKNIKHFEDTLNELQGTSYQYSLSL